jgi:hypothetical protein
MLWPMISAAMIDGFGAFADGDYRRLWLSFDSVRYILPPPEGGPLHYPAFKGREAEFQVDRGVLTATELEDIATSALSDSAQPWFREIAEKQMTSEERDYASLVVWPEVSAHPTLARELTKSNGAAVAFLLNKLVRRAIQDGAVPIVGKPYASELIARKMAAVEQDAPTLVTPKQASSFAAFAAGLSLTFVSDEGIRQVPFTNLVRFKEKNSDLLRRHQHHLLETALAFTKIPVGDEFAERLAALRLAALKAREQLDAEARDAWMTMGLDLTKKAITAVSLGVFTGIAVLQSHSLSQIATAAAPVGATAAGVVVLDLLDAAKRIRQAKRAPFAYVVRAAENFGAGGRE